MPAHTLILDGFMGRPWRWEPLRRLIEQRCGSASIFRYDWTGRLTLPQLGERLAEEAAKYPDGVNLVGFSMGGMVIRAARHVAPELNVNKTVFLNSPHRGTWLACLIPTPGVRQMRPFDPFLKAIAEKPWKGDTLTVWSGIDGIILPGKNTRFDTGRHVKCAIPLHIWPVWSRTIHHDIVEFLLPATNEPKEPRMHADGRG